MEDSIKKVTERQGNSINETEKKNEHALKLEREKF
jgi:hypothetical protein